MSNISIKKPDTLGACASALCMLHCMATPFLFLAAATSCSQSCCNAAPLWYQSLDYFFILLSFFAVLQSTKSSNTNWIKYGLWVSWIALFMVILNVHIYQWIYLSKNIKFIPSFTLIGLHLYNQKYSQCLENDCCA